MFPARQKRTSTIKLLISIAVPIAIGALVMNVASLVDSTLIQRRLYDIMQNNPEELTAIYKDLIAQELVETIRYILPYMAVMDMPLRL